MDRYNVPLVFLETPRRLLSQGTLCAVVKGSKQESRHSAGSLKVTTFGASLQKVTILGFPSESRHAGFTY